MMIATGFAAILLPELRIFLRKEAPDYRLRLPAGKAKGVFSRARLRFARHRRGPDMGLPQAKLSVREEFPPETSLLAEIERLKRELAVARARIVELEARADVDPLLDILNRRGFERELKRALAHSKRYGTPAAVMFVDLDNFKSVNDRHGHGTGDSLLKAVTREITRHVRASDVGGRLGGDEFGVLLWRGDETTGESTAREVASESGRR